jgi:hypothetical protein
MADTPCVTLSAKIFTSKRLFCIIMTTSDRRAVSWRKFITTIRENSGWLNCTQTDLVNLINLPLVVFAVLTPFFGTCQVRCRKEVGGPSWNEGGKSADLDDWEEINEDRLMGLPIGGLADFAQGVQPIADWTLLPIGPNWASGVLWLIRFCVESDSWMDR